jgi:hypothetical protein
MPECRTVRHPVSPVTDGKKLTKPKPVRYRTKLTQSGIFLVRYRTKIRDTGMPMPALVSSMPMPSYAVILLLFLSLFLIVLFLFVFSYQASFYLNLLSLYPIHLSSCFFSFFFLVPFCLVLFLFLAVSSMHLNLIL